MATYRKSFLTPKTVDRSKYIALLVVSLLALLLAFAAYGLTGNSDFVGCAAVAIPAGWAGFGWTQHNGERKTVWTIIGASLAIAMAFAFFSGR